MACQPSRNETDLTGIFPQATQADGEALCGSQICTLIPRNSTEIHGLLLQFTFVLFLTNLTDETFN